LKRAEKFASKLRERRGVNGEEREEIRKEKEEGWL